MDERGWYRRSVFKELLVRLQPLPLIWNIDTIEYCQYTDNHLKIKVELTAETSCLLNTLR
jgi:hypothetical protein